MNEWNGEEAMTTREAAEAIGCTIGHVRLLVRTGRLKAREVRSKHGHYYEVAARSVRSYCRGVGLDTRGRPRVSEGG
jgi:hypothetical protein